MVLLPKCSCRAGNSGAQDGSPERRCSWVDADGQTSSQELGASLAAVSTSIGAPQRGRGASVGNYLICPCGVRAAALLVMRNIADVLRRSWVVPARPTKRWIV